MSTTRATEQPYVRLPLARLPRFYEDALTQATRPALESAGTVFFSHGTRPA